MITPLSPALLEILICPVCHHPLECRHQNAGAENTASRTPSEKNPGGEWLRCRGCGLCYPIQDGIPVMLEERAFREPGP